MTSQTKEFVRRHALPFPQHLQRFYELANDASDCAHGEQKVLAAPSQARLTCCLPPRASSPPCPSPSPQEQSTAPCRLSPSLFCLFFACRGLFSSPKPFLSTQHQRACPKERHKPARSSTFSRCCCGFDFFFFFSIFPPTPPRPNRIHPGEAASLQARITLLPVPARNHWSVTQVSRTSTDTKRQSQMGI